MRATRTVERAGLMKTIYLIAGLSNSRHGHTGLTVSKGCIGCAKPPRKAMHKLNPTLVSRSTWVEVYRKTPSRHMPG